MDVVDAGAVVFGGASGLGEATARRLAAGGARVVIADLNEDRGAEIANELDGRFVAADVQSPDAVAEAIGAAHDAGGERGLRISVCCAGIGTPEKLIGRDGVAPLETYQRIIGVNLLGTINVARLAAGAMVENAPDQEWGERGLIVNTASVAAYEGQIGQTAYSASKGGIVGFTLPAARDLASFGVRVMTIAPGLFDTPLLASLPEPAKEALGQSIPFPPKLGSPDLYAQLVLSIAENPLLNGEVIRIDGALRLAPR